MAIRLGSDKIVVIDAPLATDPRDNTRYRDWDNATRTVVENCNIQATKLSDKLRYEDDDEREYHMTYFRGYAPPGAPIKYTSRIEFNGDVYDVQSKPTEWRQFDGTPHHITFMMKLQEG